MDHRCGNRRAETRQVARDMDDPEIIAATQVRENYVQHLLDRFRRTPGTCGRIRRQDRRLAAQLHQRGVPSAVVTAAFALAASRRHCREPGLPPLPPIRSLHYFLPVIEELLAGPLDADYLRYLEGKLESSGDQPERRPLWSPRSP
jgi:hypothetical protein